MTREVTGCTTRMLFSSGIYGNCQNKQAELDQIALRIGPQI